MDCVLCVLVEFSVLFVISHGHCVVYGVLVGCVLCVVGCVFLMLLSTCCLLCVL